MRALTFRAGAFCAPHQTVDEFRGYGVQDQCIALTSDRYPRSSGKVHFFPKLCRDYELSFRADTDVTVGHTL